MHNSTVVNYGSHMAVHIAIGLLFLGGGRLALASSPRAVAALLVAFFPKFPTHSSDNRYHLQVRLVNVRGTNSYLYTLQALRHLYVLAVEPRLVAPCCSQSGSLLSLELEVFESCQVLSLRKFRCATEPLLPTQRSHCL